MSTRSEEIKRTAIEDGVKNITEFLPRLHAKKPDEAKRIACEALEDIRRHSYLDLEPGLMEVIQKLGIQVDEVIGMETATEELSPQTIAEALRDLIEEDEFEDIASCVDTQDAMGVAYGILMEIHGDDEDKVNAVLAEHGITEPEQAET